MSAANHAGDEAGQRLARASHDLGNLLGVILNYSTLLTRQLRDPVALADVEQVRLAAERAAGIVRDLTSASHGPDQPEGT